MSIKRSRPKIIEKLIETGLIENARQVKRGGSGGGTEGGERKPKRGGTSCWENTGRNSDFIETSDSEGECVQLSD